MAVVVSEWGRAGNRGSALTVENAIVESPPSTVGTLSTGSPPVPPLLEPGSGSAIDTVVDRASPATSSSSETATTSRSPLVDLLGPTYSVLPEEVRPRPRPTGLAINSIDVTAYPIRQVGLEVDGQLEIPNESEIGWYRYGATVGRPGVTVLAAHVSWNDTTGPFYDLGSVEPGDAIAVTLDDGTERRYVVTERTMYDKDELPRERIWRTTGPESLVLITCGGDFNPEIRRFRQNIVVYAVPVG
jgi:Sortase domain